MNLTVPTENPHLWQDWRVSSWINSDKFIHPYPSFFCQEAIICQAQIELCRGISTGCFFGPSFQFRWKLGRFLSLAGSEISPSNIGFVEKKTLEGNSFRHITVSPMFHVPDWRESVWLWWFWNFGMLRITAQTTNDVSFRCWLEDSKQWTMIESGYLTLAC